MNSVSCGALIGAVLVLVILSVIHQVKPNWDHPSLNQDCVREVQWQDAGKTVKRNIQDVCRAD
jgi:hypothetical protein